MHSDYPSFSPISVHCYVTYEKHFGRPDYPLDEPRIMYRGTVGYSAIEAILVKVAK